MNEFLEILKYTLPSLVVGASTILTIRYFFDNEQKNRQAGWRDQNRAVVTPIRLQAYERIMLFLERINPGSLIVRISDTGQDARTLQRALVNAVREEYEHNLSLQVYMSVKAWEMVKSGKEELITVINQAAGEVPADAEGLELSRKIFELYLKQEKPSLVQAVEFLKKEINQFF
ncbi:MAG TPA: hypothetical protein P5531_02635 [Bacteroidales bacterium]|nr:hypothetical protein [Bacteroidales bacterium]HSA43191.1 hypothetical protein [Bacteroidales bacterium]